MQLYFFFFNLNFTTHLFLSPRLPQITDSLSLVREILQQLTNQRASIEEDIQSSFDDLHKQLDVRKSVLLMELEVTFGLKQKVIYHGNKMYLNSCIRLEVMIHSIHRTMFPLYPGPPGPARQLGAERRGHQIHL